MTFNYNKLKGRVIEVCGSHKNFAKKMEISERALSTKFNGKVAWNQKDICKAMIILELKVDDIPEYFFNAKVQ